MPPAFQPLPCCSLQVYDLVLTINNSIEFYPDPLPICTWFFNSLVWNFEISELDFFKVRTEFLLPAKIQFKLVKQELRSQTLPCHENFVKKLPLCDNIIPLLWHEKHYWKKPRKKVKKFSNISNILKNGLNEPKTSEAYTTVSQHLDPS